LKNIINYLLNFKLILIFYSLF